MATCQYMDVRRSKQIDQLRTRAILTKETGAAKLFSVVFDYARMVSPA